MEITLKSGRKIGDGHPPYIIAEVGSNWKTLGDCRLSIHQAKLAGADAVKFQLFTHKELYGLDGTMQGELPREWVPQLKIEADKRGIDFMCTAFSPEGYAFVDPYVDLHKVASSECCDTEILNKVNNLGKPVILSTGAKGATDIRLSFNRLRVPMVLMYCSVSYPAKFIDLGRIDLLKREFNTLVGYSDHSTDIAVIPKVAIHQYSACVLEKHFKYEEMTTPDSPHSLEVHEFKTMVEYIKNSDRVYNLSPTWEETPALRKYNRRIIATKDLAPGDILKKNVNYGSYRSLKDDQRAAHPENVYKFHNKVMKVSLKAGEGLWIDDVNE